MAEFSTDQKREIILAAIVSAGPGATDSDVTAKITHIVGLFEEGSPAMRAFARAEQRAESTSKVAGFRGIVLFVDLETTSQRPIVFFKTEVSDNAPEGIEVLRMDRIDGQDGERAKALANEAMALVGHQVGVTKAVERAGSGNNNVRVLRSIEDQGVAAEFAGLKNQEGHKYIDWKNGGKGNFAKIEPKLARLQRYREAEAAATQTAAPALASA